jgi:hypothetical protein
MSVFYPYKCVDKSDYLDAIDFCNGPAAVSQDRKKRVLKNGSNNQYKPKNMRYAQYIRTQPGFTTFANKKYVNPLLPKAPINLQTTVAAKQLCFTNVWCGL